MAPNCTLVQKARQHSCYNLPEPSKVHYSICTSRIPTETGFMGIEVPEEYGGAGLDTMAYVLALEEICKADAAHGTIMSVNNSLYAHGLMKYGTEEQKRKFLVPVASGKAVGAYSLTEPMSGSDAGTMRSRAVKNGETYILNGRQSWVTSGPVAEYIVGFMMTKQRKEHTR